MVRVTLVGAESTGKTVLAAALARHFGAPWVREYGRDITEAKIHNAGGDISKLTWCSCI
jgi:nicotinamide riboside kinase